MKEQRTLFLVLPSLLEVALFFFYGWYLDILINKDTWALKFLCFIQHSKFVLQPKKLKDKRAGLLWWCCWLTDSPFQFYLTMIQMYFFTTKIPHFFLQVNLFFSLRFFNAIHNNIMSRLTLQIFCLVWGRDQTFTNCVQICLCFIAVCGPCFTQDFKVIKFFLSQIINLPWQFINPFIRRIHNDWYISFTTFFLNCFNNSRTCALVTYSSVLLFVALGGMVLIF